jgi:polar amino acid transport system ATP-binding protein
MAVLQVENIQKSFGQIKVLDGISFTMEKGEVLSLIGSSGSGKTTLLRCLNFLEKADSGEILVRGNSVYKAVEGEKPEVSAEAQLSFGLVFQQFNLFPQYNVMDNLMLAPKLRAKRKSTEGERESLEEIRARAEVLLAKIGLSEKAAAYPCELSGGQQQRVAIARALMLSPEILCFD